MARYKSDNSADSNYISNLDAVDCELINILLCAIIFCLLLQHHYGLITSPQDILNWLGSRWDRKHKKNAQKTY